MQEYVWKRDKGLKDEMAKGAAEKPTRSEVDALVDKGLTVKQNAEIYRCSVNTIATIKSRKPQGWREIMWRLRCR